MIGWMVKPTTLGHILYSISKITEILQNFVFSRFALIFADDRTPCIFASNSRKLQDCFFIV